MKSYTSNRDNDMAHVRSAAQMADEQAAGRWTAADSVLPRGTYGDTTGGKSFSDEQAAMLASLSHSRRAVGAGWYEVWAGPGCTLWTVITTAENTAEEVAIYEEAMASDT